jgi:hypothetical protein
MEVRKLRGIRVASSISESGSSIEGMDQVDLEPRIGELVCLS